jgi:DNA-binding Lrp family transcriptional regulator
VLDAVDAVLVRELQADGRATFQALADRVGLSRTAVRTRVQHLLDSGIVRVVGIVHASVVGTGAIGHLAIDVDGPAQQVADAVARRPAAWFAALTVGRHPVIAEFRARDDAALADEVDAVRALPGVRSIEVFRVISVVKDAHSVVSELPDISLDEIDWRLLRELTHDGRTPYTRLAEIVGLSQAATRARAVRLMRSGVIHVTGIVDSQALGSGELAGLGVRVSSDVEAAATRIGSLSGVNYVVTGFGRHDLICGIDATSRDVLLSTLEAVRAVPGVWVTDTWQHLSVVKRIYGAELP